MCCQNLLSTRGLETPTFNQGLSFPGWVELSKKPTGEPHGNKMKLWAGRDPGGERGYYRPLIKPVW